MSSLVLFLDLFLIGLLGAGLFYAVRLTRQLSEMRAARAGMERFVLDFNATVSRAEAGIKGLKTTARSSGDDLEKLIDRAADLRDELHFLVESADGIASRLSTSAAAAARNGPAAEKKDMTAKPHNPSAAPQATRAAEALRQLEKRDAESFSGASAAERELQRVLKKLG